MKFNIGDRVQTKLTRTPGTVRRIRDGMVAVETDDPNYGVPLPSFGIQRGLFLSADEWEKIPPSKIIITSDGKTTLARLYDGNRVIRRAEAKCSPEDTYDFATGANLAYDRLMRPTREPYAEPKAEPVKHLYSGKVVCVETHDDFTVGKVYTFAQGKVTDDSWTRRPMSSFVAESLEDWNSRYCYSVARFVEYKGEAT
jgi:hypothetical protein